MLLDGQAADKTAPFGPLVKYWPYGMFPCSIGSFLFFEQVVKCQEERFECLGHEACGTIITLTYAKGARMEG